MSIHWDRSKKRWRFEFARKIGAAKERVRITRLLPEGWDQAQADAFDRAESARIYAEHAGVAKEPPKESPSIEEAIRLYISDKRKAGLKSIDKAEEHLAMIAWAYVGKKFEDLPSIADEVREAYVEDGYADATAWQRLGVCRTWVRSAVIRKGGRIFLRFRAWRRPGGLLWGPAGLLGSS